MKPGYRDADGNLQSKIKPQLTTGAACPVSRQLSQYIVTEYGKALMKCQSIWKRTENLIEIAHPQFREALIKEAEKMGFWKPSFKLETSN
ncbi:MAG: acetyl-CoA hydrolase/transferase C-terminal domain-containing protein [Syntrophomonadaceae bacterium]